ncbi:hypothetical protein B0H13DRAFT_2092089, partial [Mycena leptocephala]
PICQQKDYAHAISTDAARLSVFSVMSGAAIWVKQTSSWAGKPFFSSDGQILACTHKGLDDHDIWHVAISPQNDYIAVVFLPSVCIFRIEDGVMTWQSNEPKPSVWYLSDGKLANVYSNEQLVNGQTGESWIGSHLTKGQSGDIHHSISVSPDTTLLAVDQTVRVWQCCPQTQTWSCIAVLYGHSWTVLSVAFLPDGKRIISAGEAQSEYGISRLCWKERRGLVVDAWFRQGICLGGWRMDEPFLFKGVQPLEWRIQSEQEDGGNDTR